MKQCTKCKKTKSHTEFWINSKNKDGYEYYCKSCKSKAGNKKEVDARYYEKNREERIEKNRIYELANIEQSRRNHKLYMRKRRQDPKWRLKESIMALINFHLPKKSKQTNEYLGCSYKEYFVYLEQRFDSNMNWDNYGTYWEIDHIHPLSKGGSFHFTNTQPMEVIENRKKSNKVI
ncbi:HNH endonuclease [bacterium]|nr:HNH endonuclease [bacterium]